MGFQPFNGHEIAIKLVADVAIPPYRIVKFKPTDATKVTLATAGSVPLAVSVPPEEAFMPDGSGGIVPRTGWNIGETPLLYDSGTVYVELGETVTAGQKCVPGASGKGYAQDEPTFTDAAISTHDDAKINAAINGLIDEIQAARTSDASVLGEYFVGGDAGDIVPVKIDK